MWDEMRMRTACFARAPQRCTSRLSKLLLLTFQEITPLSKTRNQLSDSTETPVAIEECLALGLDGVRGIVADSKAYCQRTLGLCLEQRVGLLTLVPRTCAVRQELEAWGQQHSALPLLLE